MTVQDTTRRAGPFVGNGTQTSFPFAFAVFSADDVEVRVGDSDSEKVIASGFTVTLNANQETSPGGTVDFAVAPTTGTLVVILSAVEYDQPLDLPSGGNFSPRALERQLDRIAFQVQQLRELAGRALTVPPTSGADPVLPPPVGGNVIGWDEEGAALRNVDPFTLASVVAYSSRRVLTADGGAASYTLDVDPGVIANTMVAVSGVLQTPNVDYTLSGTTLTPTPAFPAGTGNVVIVYGQALPVGAVTPDQMPFDATAAYVASTLGGHTIGDPIDPHDFPWLVVGDGSTDDAAKLNAALAYAASSGRRIVQLRGKTYRCAASILLSSAGLQLRGVGPTGTTLLIDHTSGPGVSISAGYCGLLDLTVRASSTRAAYTTGSTYAMAAGLFGVQAAAPADGGYITATRIERVWSQDHPNHGFYMGGYGVDSHYSHCAAYANRGAGFFFDDRSLIGGAGNNRCGQVSLFTCRALDNGGPALDIDCTTGPTYRFWVYNFETIWNSWNPSVPGYVNAEFKLGGENHVIHQSAVSPGPGGHTRTVGTTGRARLAATSVADGMYIGSNSGSITLIEPRFIRTARGVKTAASVPMLHLRSIGGYFTPQEPGGVPTNQFYGFDIGSGYQGLEISVQAGQPVSFMVYTPTQGGTVRIGNVEGMAYGNNTGSVFRRTPGYVNATIASSSVNAQSTFVSLQTASAVNLVAIVFAGGANPLPAGEIVHFLNGSAFTITLKHGTSAGYIRTKSGADVVVPAGGRFSVVTDASGNPYEL